MCIFYVFWRIIRLDLGVGALEMCTSREATIRHQRTHMCVCVYPDAILSRTCHPISSLSVSTPRLTAPVESKNRKTHGNKYQTNHYLPGERSGSSVQNELFASFILFLSFWIQRNHVIRFHGISSESYKQVLRAIL